MQKIEDPKLIAEIKAIKAAREPAKPVNPMDAMTRTKVEDPDEIRRIKSIIDARQRITVPKGAVENYIKSIQSGAMQGPGNMELLQAEDQDFFDRYITGGAKQIAHGFSSIVPATATVLGGLADRLGVDQGQDLAQWGNEAQQFLDDHLAVTDPNFYHHLMGGIGSMASFLLPGIGVSGVVGKVAQTARFVQGGAKALKAAQIAGEAAELTKAGTILQKGLGLTAMSVLESGVEMADRQRQLMDEGMTAGEANDESDRVFWYNLPVLMATNYGFFHPMTRLGRMALEAPSEGLQERWQSTVQGAISGEGKWSDFLDPSKYMTETAIGAIIGGGAAGLLPGEGGDPDAKPEGSESFEGEPLENFDPVEDEELDTVAPVDSEAEAVSDAFEDSEAERTGGPEVDAEMRDAARERDDKPNVEGTSQTKRINQQRNQVGVDRARRREADRMNGVHRLADEQARLLGAETRDRTQTLAELERGLNDTFGTEFSLEERLDEDQLVELEAMVRSVYTHPDAFAREDLAEYTFRRAREMLLMSSRAGDQSDARIAYDSVITSEGAPGVEMVGPDAKPPRAPGASLNVERPTLNIPPEGVAARKELERIAVSPEEIVVPEPTTPTHTPGPPIEENDLTRELGRIATQGADNAERRADTGAAGPVRKQDEDVGGDRSGPSAGRPAAGGGQSEQAAPHGGVAADSDAITISQLEQQAADATKVFHGSTKAIEGMLSEEFSGSQTGNEHGYGIYVAGEAGSAEVYVGVQFYSEGKRLESKFDQSAAKAISKGESGKLIEMLQDELKRIRREFRDDNMEAEPSPEFQDRLRAEKKRIESQIERVAELEASGVQESKEGRLYEVASLRPESHFIDVEKSMDRQSDYVKKALGGLNIPGRTAGTSLHEPGGAVDKAMGGSRSSEKEMSDALYDLGIAGVTFSLSTESNNDAVGHVVYRSQDLGKPRDVTKKTLTKPEQAAKPKVKKDIKKKTAPKAKPAITHDERMETDDAKEFRRLEVQSQKLQGDQANTSTKKAIKIQDELSVIWREQDRLEKILGADVTKTIHDEVYAAEPITVESLNEQAKNTGSAKTVFVSGLSKSPADLRGVKAAGQPIGVSLSNSLSPNVESEIVDAANNGLPVFIDSGAFTASTKGKEMNWERVVEDWKRIISRVDVEARRNLHIVAPDIVGDHPGSMDLQYEMMKAIESLMGSGVQVIVPVQKENDGGSLSAHAADASDGFAEFENVIIGIPFNKSAWTVDDVVSLAKAKGVERFHLLGVGSEKKLASIMKSIHAINPNVEVTADATTLRARAGAGKALTSELQAARKAKEESKGAPLTKSERGEIRTEVVKQALSPVTPESLAEQAAKPKKAKPKKVKAGTTNLTPISEVHTDPHGEIHSEPLQERDKSEVGPEGFNEEKVQGYVENYEDAKVGIVTVWRSPRDGKLYVLDGHHTLETERRVGKKEVETKEFKGTEKQAIKLSRELNASKSPPSLITKAKNARRWVKSKMTKAAMEIEGKLLYSGDWSTVKALAHLNPTGRLMSAIKALEGNADAKGDVMKMARWIGHMREKWPTLTDAHETEMFKHLEANLGLRGLTSETAFEDLVGGSGFLGVFDATRGLNLGKSQAKDGREGNYEKQIKDLESEQKQLKAEKKKKLKELTDEQKATRDEKRLGELRVGIKRITDRFDDEIKSIGEDIKQLQDEWLEVQKGGAEPTMFFSLGRHKGDAASFKQAMEDEDIDPMDISVKKMPDSGEWRIVRRLADALNIDIAFIEYVKDGVATKLPFPAWYDGKVFIDSNTNAPLLYLALHEIGHHMTLTNPDLFHTLMEQAIKDVAKGGEKGIWDIYVNRYAEGAIPAEFAADLFAQVMLRPGVLRSLQKQDTGVFQMIVNQIMDIMAAIKSWLVSKNFDLDPHFKTMENFEAIIVEAVGKKMADQAMARAELLKKADERTGSAPMFFRLMRDSDETAEIDESNDIDEMKEARKLTVKAEKDLAEAEGPRGIRMPFSRAGRAKMKHRIYTNLVDKNYAIYSHVRDAMKAAGRKIEDIETNVRPDKVIQLLRGWTGKANLALRYGIKAGKWSTPGLEQIIHKFDLAADIESGRFGEYLKSLRIVSIEAGKRRNGQSYFTDQEKNPELYAEQQAEFSKHQKIVSHYSKLNPKWALASKEITKFANSVMHQAVEADMMSQEQFDELVEKYDVYAPMFVMARANEIGIAASKVKVGAGKVAHAQGEILVDTARMDPMDSLIKTTYRITHLSEQNMAKLSLVKIIEDLAKQAGKTAGEGIAGLGRKVAPKQMPKWKSTEDLLRALGFSYRGHPEWKAERKRQFQEAKAEALGESGMEWGDLSKEEKADITRHSNQVAGERTKAIITEYILSDLRNNGIDIQADNLETMHQIWVSAQLQDQGVMAVMRDGKIEYWEIDPEIYDVFASQGAQLPDALRTFYSAQTTLLRAGAVLTPEFMARNPLRDILMSAIQAKDLVDVKELPIFPVVAGFRLVKGLSHVIKKDDIWQDWVRSGGAMAEMVSIDREGLRDQMKDLTRTKTIGGRQVRLARNPLEFLQLASMLTEQATRVATFERTKSKEMARGKTEEQAGATAALASREGSLDFGRSGTIGSQLNIMVPFFNATIQGTDKLFRTLSQGTKSEKTAAWTKLVGLVTLPSLVSWALNHDEEWYDEQPLWLKNSFWSFSFDGGKTIIYYPKPFEAGVLFGSLPERLLDYAYKKDKKALDSWARSFLEVTIPVRLEDMGGPMVATAIEIMSNHDHFRKTDIVRGHLKDVEAREQYTQSTSSIAKAIGNAAPGGGLSPQKIEHFVRGSFGGLGMHDVDIASTVYDATRSKDEKARKRAAQKAMGFMPVDVPILGRFVKSFSRPTPEAFTRHLDDWYEFYDHVNKVTTTYRTLSQSGAKKDRLASLLRREGKWIGAAPGVIKIQKQIATLNSAIRAIEGAPASKYTKKERGELIDNLLVQRSQFAKYGLEEIMRKLEEDPKGLQKSLDAAADSIMRKR